MEEKSVKLNICYGCMNRIEEGKEICPHCGYICTRKNNPQDALPEGTVLFRKYLVGKVLGRGGFGVTYLGYDLDLQIRVAIKEFFPLGLSTRSTMDYSVLPSTNGEDEAFSRGCAAFLEEARTLAAYESPYIVRVRDYFREHDTAYLVMAYVDGKTLSAEIVDNGGRIPADRLLSLMKPLILQLDKLHKRNIIHRDIAPDNLVIVKDTETGEEHFVLLDFGAARSFVSSKISQKYTATVKNGYAPIEQYSQKSKQGPFTDVYALCATIYAALTGVVPPSALERSADGAQIEPLSKYGVNLPDYVEQAILHGLAQNGEERTQTMRQLYDELTTVPDARELEYKKALTMLGSASSETDYRNTEKAFTKLGDFKDASAQAAKCRAKAEECHKRVLYTEAKELMAENTLSGYEKAIKKFTELGDWQDAKHELDFCCMKVKELKGNRKKSGLLPIVLAILIALGAGFFTWQKINAANEQNRLQQAVFDEELKQKEEALQQKEEALKESREKLQEAEKARTVAEAEAKARSKEAEDAIVAAEAAEKARANAEAEAQAKTKEAEDAKAMAESAEKAMAEARAESEARAEEVAKARAEAESRTTEAEQAKAEAEAAKKSAEEAKALAEAAERKAAETEKTAGASAKEAEDALKEARAAAEAAEQKAAEAEALAQARAAEAEKAKAEAESAAKSAEEAKAAASAAEQRATEATEARTAAEQRAAEATEAKTTAEQKAEEAATAKAEAEQKAEEATAAKTAAEQKATEAAEAKQEAERKAEAEAKERKEAEEKETAYYNAISLFTSGSYGEAKEAFLALGEYRDSKAYVTKCDAALEALEKEAKATPAPTPAVTPKPTPTPTAKPSPAPTKKPIFGNIDTIQVGDYVNFGSYEQDNRANGPEPIEWQVLDIQNGNALLLSRYGLDYQIYNDRYRKISWETSQLRSWLNNSFYVKAFTGDERSCVLDSIVAADNNPDYNISPGNDTTDKVFLLSIPEVFKYLPTETKCEPTAFAEANGAEKGRTGWWLRSPGWSQVNTAIVNGDGSLNTRGTNTFEKLVRPAVWVELTGLSNASYSVDFRSDNKDEETNPIGLKIDFVVNETIQELHKGETVFFGHYWQNSIVKGKEPIEWIVLDTQDGKAFLVSKYALDCKNYGFDKQNEATWRSSYIRSWLNNTFLSTAFNAKEQQFILESDLANPANSKYGTSSGEETTDRIFLLSNSEVEEYFKTAEDRACMASQYVKKTYEKSPIDPKTDNCWWWTRTSGAGSRFASGVTKDGLVHNSGDDIHNQNVCVRPAMWVSDTIVKTTFSKFGSYEQDNDLTNGKEPIEWQVLDVQDNKALLISNYALDLHAYNGESEPVTWETCELREWLNDTFLKTAFSDSERNIILYTKNKADAYSKSKGVAGNDTYDAVFLLSIEDAQFYIGTDSLRQCKATDYLRGISTAIGSAGYCKWWLRSTGSFQKSAAIINYSGEVFGPGAMIDDNTCTVRPAIWVSIENLPRETVENKVGEDEEKLAQEQEFVTTEEPIQNLNKAYVGDYVTFGTYEQDNDLTNGKEAIEWQVLAKEGDRILAISRYALDCQRYSKTRPVTWETCTLRKWLNGTFVNDAFDADEKALIPTVIVDAHKNPNYSTNPGNSSRDQVFLLSISEVEKYFATDVTRQCEPTAYAKARGCYTDQNTGTCWWWLRTPGFSANNVADVDSEGAIINYGDTFNDGIRAVRPALWIMLEP